MQTLKKLLIISNTLKKAENSRKVIILIICLLFLSLLIIFYQGYLYYKKQTILSSLENPATVNLSDYQQNEVLREINELYSFEENTNKAVIGKITNIERLTSRHSFFAKAKNGDYLLIMPDFTLIYDPTTKTVVDIARENLLNLKENKE